MKANRLLPLFGILAIALVVAGFVIGGETPDVDDSVEKVRAFYTKNDTDVTVGGLLIMAAAAAFLAWSVQVRSRLFLAEGGSATRTTLGLIGTVVFALGMAILAGISLALGDAPDKIDPVAIQALHVLSFDMFPPIAVGGLLTLFGYGLAVLRTRAFPAWLGWVSIVGAVFAFTPLWFVPFLTLAVFIIVTSVMLAMREEAA